MVGRYLRPIGVALALSVGLPVAVGGVVEAAPSPRTTLVTGSGSSCVGAVQGFSATDLVFSGTPQTVWVKCYFGGEFRGGTDPSAAWLTGLAGGTPSNASCARHNVSAWNFATGTETLLLGLGTDCGQSGTGDLTIVRTAPGFVEFTYKVWSTIGPGAYGFKIGTSHAGGRACTAADCSASPSTDYLLHYGWDIGTGFDTSKSGLMIRWDEYETTMPPYRWGDEVDPPSLCETADMYLAEPGRLFAPGEFAAVEWLGADPADFTDSVQRLRYRWSPSDPWTVLWERAGVLNPGPPPAEPTLVRNNTTGGRLGTTLEIECTDLNDVVRYLRGDTSSSTDPQVARPCSGLVVSWPDEGIYPGGEAVSFTFAVRDGYDGIEGLIMGGGRFGGEQSDPVTNITDVGTISFLNPSGDPASYPLGAGQYIARFTFDDTWNTDDGLFLSCDDDAGTLNFQYKAPSGVGKLPLPETYGDRFDECLDGVNFGWRPSSWVPAFFRTTGCVAEVLFVPVGSDIDAFLDGWGAISSKAPLSFIVETGSMLYGFFDDLPSTLTAHRSDCVDVLGASPEVGAEDGVEICPVDLASAPVTLVRNVLAAGVYLGYGWGLWQSTRRVLSA